MHLARDKHSHGKVWLRAAALGAALLLAACQTAGSDGVLSSVLPDSSSTPEQTDVLPTQDPGAEQVATATQPGRNPNASARQINTKTALSDYCPAVRVRAGTETLRSFPQGADKSDEANLRYQAVISDVARECAYVGQDLKINVGARGRVITGPKGGSGDITLPIRVAVTVGNETVYSKLHTPQQTIAQGATNAVFQFVDTDVVIPAPTATNVRVFLGFDEGPN